MNPYNPKIDQHFRLHGWANIGEVRAEDGQPVAAYTCTTKARVVMAYFFAENTVRITLRNKLIYTGGLHNMNQLASIMKQSKIPLPKEKTTP